MSLTDSPLRYRRRFLPPKNLNTTIDLGTTNSLTTENVILPQFAERSEVPLEELSFGKSLFRTTDGYRISLRYSPQTGLCIWVHTRQLFICYVSVPNTGIKAVNLQISSNVPGSLTSMHTSLLLEASEPLNIRGSQHMPSTVRPSHKLLPSKRYHILKIRSNLKYAGDIHNMLVGLKGPNNIELINSTQTFQEGLPYWAAYIPSYLYSFQLRSLIQLLIAIYTYFNVLLAFWQLYRHVDLIHASLRPLVQLFDYYLHHTSALLVLLFNAVAEFWWEVFKPILLIYSNFEVFLKLFSLFKPLLTHLNLAYSCFLCVADILREVLRPLWLLSSPIFRLFLSLAGQIVKLKIILFPFKSVFSFVWQTLRVLNTYSPSLEIVVRNSMRSLFVNSVKTIFMGIFYMFQKVWHYRREKLDQRELNRT